MGLSHYWTEPRQRKKYCAICLADIRYEDRLCRDCYREWRHELSSAWLQALIEYEAYVFALATREWRHNVEELVGERNDDYRRKI